MAYQEQERKGLFDMLSDLSKDDELLKQFAENPSDVMGKYELEENQQRLIESALQGEIHDFYKAVGDEATGAFKNLDGHLRKIGKVPEPKVIC